MAEAVSYLLLTNGVCPRSFTSLHAKGYPGGRYGSQRWHQEESGLAGPEFGGLAVSGPFVAEAQGSLGVSAVIAYKDAQAIPLMYQRVVRRVLCLGRVTAEIIFVNDGSPDDTSFGLAGADGKATNMCWPRLFIRRTSATTKCALSGMYSPPVTRWFFSTEISRIPQRSSPP